MLDSLSYRIITVKPGQLGIVAVIEVSADGNSLHRDEVKLWNEKERKKFSKKCGREEAVKHLCKIEDELKRFTVESIAQSNGAAVALPQEFADKIVHPAIHFEAEFASVGIVQREAGEEKFLIVTSTGNVYPAETLAGALKPAPLSHPELSGRWGRLAPPVAWIDALGLLIHTIQRQIWFEDERWYSALSIWIAGTYLYSAFPSYPYLHLTGEKGSGKTKFQEIAQQSAFNAIRVVDPTPAVLFRLVNALRPTMMIDESEKMNSDDAREIQSLINAGYKRGASVPRVEGEDRHIEFFEVYSPKCLASIRSLGAATEDRCISVVMSKPEQTDPRQNSWIDSADPAWAKIRDGFYNLTLKHSREILQQLAATTLPNGKALPDWLRARDRELWFPLLLLAAYADRAENLGAYDDVLGLASESMKERGLSFETEAIIGVLESKLDSQDVFSVHPVDLVPDLEGALARKGRVSPEWVAGRLRSLGFKKGSPPRDRQGVIYEIDAKRLFEIKTRYTPGMSPKLTYTPTPEQPTPEVSNEY